jgi:hypothetical protein
MKEENRLPSRENLNKTTEMNIKLVKHDERVVRNLNHAQDEAFTEKQRIIVSDDFGEI